MKIIIFLALFFLLACTPEEFAKALEQPVQEKSTSQSSDLEISKSDQNMKFVNVKLHETNLKLVEQINKLKLELKQEKNSCTVIIDDKTRTYQNVHEIITSLEKQRDDAIEEKNKYVDELNKNRVELSNCLLS